MITTALGIYVYMNGSAVIYVSDSPPGVDELSLIREWQSLPSVDLIYSGPEDVEKTVHVALKECGILTGGGSPLFIRADEQSKNVAIWIRYKDEEWDNYNSPSEISSLSEDLKIGLKKTIGCYKTPGKGFLIKFSPDGVSAEISSMDEPSRYVFSSKNVYKIYLDGTATNVERGFHEIDGNLFFAGKDGMNVETARFFKDVEMIFQIGRKVAIYSSGVLTFDGKTYRVDMVPVGFWNGDVVLPDRVIGKDKRMLKSTAVDVYRDFILEADGYIEAVDGSWRKKVSCTPLEWYWNDEKLHVLDVCGYYREVDLQRENVVYSKRVPGSYGFDFLKGKVLFMNGENFCVVKGEKIYGKCARLHNGYAVVVEKNGISVLGRKLFLKAKSFKFVNGCLMVIGDDGVWLVKFKE